MRYMGSLGNDIIDWQRAKTQQHKLKQRYLEKLCTPSEIDYIHQHDFPLWAFWRSWAAKEAAYKAWQKYVQAQPIFNPITFEIVSYEAHEMTINKDQNTYRVSLISTKDYIYAALISNQKLTSKLFRHTSEYAEFLLHLKLKTWEFKKDSNGIPFFKNEASEATFPVSKTHDGNWIALQFESDFEDLIFPIPSSHTK